MVRRRLSDWLYAVGDWLEKSGRHVVYLSDRIHPHDPKRGPLGDLITTTLHNRRAKIVADLVKNNALLRHLAERGTNGN